MLAVRSEGSTASQAAWDADLRRLLQDADALFADVAWHDEEGGATVYAHKFILYARASGAFQQAFLGVPHSLSETSLSRIGQSSASLRTFTPTSAIADGRVPAGLEKDNSGAANVNATLQTARSRPLRLSLRSADVPVFKAALKWFYTAGEEDEAFRTVLDGFQDGALAENEGVTGIKRLREDLLYSWRSKLYADVSLVLDGAPGGPFAAHRAMLAVRSPYFRALLLGEYSDSSAQTLALPSPPFTPASTTFVLGYLYSGTLDFSTRNFDLSTAFELWRCAAFLGLSTLQDELEDWVCSTLTTQRAARVFAFAHAPDVCSNRLASAAMPHLVERLDPTWVASPHVGEVDYEAQKKLVRAACDNVKPDNAASVAVQVAACRRKLASSSWAEHVRAMLEAVEAQLVDVLANNLDGVVRSAGFNDLVDGVGFNSDVLEWLLGLLVKGLTESQAAQVYQVLVEKVLLREKGLRADARVLVEDARAGVVRYLKRKWDGVRQCGGFNVIAPQVLKELAVELDISPEDLLAKHPAARTPTTRARRPPLHLLEGRPSPVKPTQTAASIERVAPRLVPRASLPTQSSAVGATHATRRGGAIAARAPAARVSIGRNTARVANTPSPETSDAVAARPTPRARPSTTRADDEPRPSTEAIRAAPSASTPRPETASRAPRLSRTTLRHPEAPPSSSAKASRAPVAAARPDSTKSSSARDRSSSASTATSRTLARPPSTSSIRSTRTLHASTPTVRGRTRGDSQSSLSHRHPTSGARSSADNPARGLRKFRPAASPQDGQSAPSGTALLAPIPCIVTVRCDRLFRIRAQVRYIGPLDGQQGEWVGVEAPATAIPGEALNLPWGDGSRNGVTYFDLSADDSSGGLQAASVSENAALDNPAARTAPPPASSQTALDPSDSLRRPPSRRARRSASSDRSAAAGTRKALFVRPHQIVYVL
uniref:BTB domain-containing protein n=1 Tax=Rhodotorula toruloides TaxID=5286 RepID=A0A0K3CP01_RHOTO